MKMSRDINAANFTIQFTNDLIGSGESRLNANSDRLGTIYFYNVENTMMNKTYSVEMCTYSNVCHSDFGKTREEAGDTGRWIVPENKEIDDTYFLSIKNITFSL